MGFKRIQIIAALYLLTYILALYFSTGVHTGFKLDSDQLWGYVCCGVLSGLITGSLFAKRIKSRKFFSMLMLINCFIIFGVTRYNVVSFNEAFWYFILFVYFIPFIELVETTFFIFDLN